MAQSVTLLLLYLFFVYEYISESDELELIDASAMWLVLRRMIDSFLLLMRLSAFMSGLFFPLLFLLFGMILDFVNEFDVFVIVIAFCLCLSVLSVMFLVVEQVLALIVFIVD